jgi:hypothetical protein
VGECMQSKDIDQEVANDFYYSARISFQGLPMILVSWNAKVTVQFFGLANFNHTLSTCSLNVLLEVASTASFGNTSVHELDRTKKGNAKLAKCSPRSYLPRCTTFRCHLMKLNWDENAGRYAQTIYTCKSTMQLTN